MTEILLNEESFRNNIENCMEYIFDDCDSKEKKFYWNELYDILNTKDENKRWSKLIASEIFRLAVGEWKEIDMFKVWIED